MADFGSVALGSFLGAMLGASSRWIEQWFDKRRRKAALATAMLLELHSLDAAFRAIVDARRPSRSDIQIASRFFQKARAADLPDMLLFKPETVYAVMKFAGMANKAKDVRDANASSETPTPKDDYYVRQRALFALNVVAQLKNCLIAEGGAIPELPPSRWYAYPELPPTPPEAFERTGPKGISGPANSQ